MSRCRGCNKRIEVLFFYPEDVTMPVGEKLPLVQESLCGTCKSWSMAALSDKDMDKLFVGIDVYEEDV